MELKKREDIIKALGLCCECAPLRCDECPMEAPPKTFKGSLSCSDELMRNALTLIKELTEEIKDLEADYERVYEQAEADIHGNMADGGTSCHWCMEKTKVDTVKRMQSRLTDMSEFMLRADHDGAMYYVDHAAWVEEIAKNYWRETNEING